MSHQQKSFLDQDNLKLYPARLMSPAEVCKAIANTPDMKNRGFERHWFLCGDVGPSMFQSIVEKGSAALAMRISGFKASSGGTYGVITHQLENFQHRMLLPLYEPPVLQCLTELNTHPLGFLLGRDENIDALILEAGAKDFSFRPLLAMAPRHHDYAALAQMVGELPQAIAAIAEFGTVPSLLSGQLVDDISVSVLPPTASIAMLVGRVAGGLQ